MQINKTNNVIFLKEFESNIISEAFVVLKEEINFTNLSPIKTKKSISKMDILKEAEFLITQKIKQNKIEYERFKINKLERKMKILKIINIISIIALISVIILNY